MWLNKYLEESTAEIENAVLCKILLSRKMIPDLLVEYFTGNRRKLFERILISWSAGNEIDPVYFKSLMPDEISNALAVDGSYSPVMIAALIKQYQKRALVETILNADIEKEPTELILSIQEGMANILLKNQKNKYNHPEAVKRLSDVIISGNHPDKKTLGYSTGLTELDKYTNGIEKGKMYAIGALKKTGKSRFCIYLSIRLREQGAGILWNSLEMNDTQLNACALAYLSDVDQAHFGRFIAPDKMTAVQINLNELVNLDWTIIREHTISELRSQIINIKTQKPIDIVFVDYIQRMIDPGRKNDRVREVEAISKQLADMSRELNVAVIVLSQLSGFAEKLKDDEMPNASHLKESQGIAETADTIITLHNFLRRENPFTETGYQLQEINCLIEQRYGLSGALFKILGDMRVCRFSNHNKPYG